jgi:dienelactone hydrolase
MPTIAPGAACLTAAERAHTVRFASGNGASLAGVLLGSGRVGLVFAHQTDADMCEWVPYARLLAAKGYTALAIDMNGFGASQSSAGVPAQPRFDQDLLAAAALLRRQGVTSVVLVGASLGGLASVVAASEAQPPVTAVVDVSGPEQMSGLDDVAAARRLTVPALFLVGERDEFVADVRAVAAAAPKTPTHRLVVIPGTASHGVALLDPAQEPQAGAARAAVESFLHDYAG